MTSSPPDLGTRRAYLVDGAWLEWVGSGEHSDKGGWVSTQRPRFVLPGGPVDSDVWVRLRCADAGAHATKVWRCGEDGAWRKVERADGRHSAGEWFHAEPVWIRNEVSAWADAWRAWRDDMAAMLVRGILARGATWDEPIRRAKSASHGAYLAPHPVGRRAVVLDCDKVTPARVGVTSWPGAQRWPTQDECARFVRAYIRATLPYEFRDAAAAWRWSASAGVPDTRPETDPESRGPLGWSRLSCHVVVMLDRDVTDQSLREWLASLRKAGAPIDPAIADSVQPLYMADPIFESAAPWPAGFDRVGVLPGHEVTRTPDVLLDGSQWRARHAAGEAAFEMLRVRQREQAEREDARIRAALVSGDPTLASRLDADIDRRRRYGLAALRGAAEDIRAAGVGGRHEALLKAAARVGRLIAGGLVTDADARAELGEAYSAVTRGRSDGPRTLRDGLRHGATAPRTWDDIKRGGNG